MFGNKFYKLGFMATPPNFLLGEVYLLLQMKAAMLGSWVLEELSDIADKGPSCLFQKVGTRHFSKLVIIPLPRPNAHTAVLQSETMA